MLEEIPRDLLNIILELLSFKDLLAINHVNRFFRGKVTVPMLCKQLDVEIKRASTIRSIANVTTRFSFLKENGEMWVYGYNKFVNEHYGSLGELKSTALFKALTHIPSLGEVSQTYFTSNSTFILKQDGTVWRSANGVLKCLPIKHVKSICENTTDSCGFFKRENSIVYMKNDAMLGTFCLPEGIQKVLRVTPSGKMLVLKEDSCTYQVKDEVVDLVFQFPVPIKQVTGLNNQTLLLYLDTAGDIWIQGMDVSCLFGNRNRYDVPMKMSGLSQIEKICNMDEHYVFYIKKDNTLWVNGGDLASHNPRFSVPMQLPINYPIVNVMKDFQHLFLILNDNTIIKKPFAAEDIQCFIQTGNLPAQEEIFTCESARLQQLKAVKDKLLQTTIPLTNNIPCASLKHA